MFPAAHADLERGRDGCWHKESYFLNFCQFPEIDKRKKQ